MLTLAPVARGEGHHRSETEFGMPNSRRTKSNEYQFEESSRVLQLHSQTLWRQADSNIDDFLNIVE